MGLQLVTVFQDLAQIRSRYGDATNTIVNNHRADRAGRSVYVLATIADKSTLETLLHGWATVGGRPDASLAWIHDRVSRYLELTGERAPDPTLPPLGTDWKASLSPVEQPLYASPPDTRWNLPAEPVAAALRGLRQTPGMDDADLATFAAGLDLDPDWVADIVDGVLVDVDVEEIAMVCESAMTDGRAFVQRTHRWTLDLGASVDIAP